MGHTCLSASTQLMQTGTARPTFFRRVHRPPSVIALAAAVVPKVALAVDEQDAVEVRARYIVKGPPVNVRLELTRSGGHHGGVASPS